MKKTIIIGLLIGLILLSGCVEQEPCLPISMVQSDMASVQQTSCRIGCEIKMRRLFDEGFEVPDVNDCDEVCREHYN